MHLDEPRFGAARLVRSRLATSAVFIVLGLLQGSIAARMPAIKHHAGLSDGMLGLALLGLPLGSLTAIQVTGRSIARWGSSPVTFAGATVMSVAVVAPAFATGFTLLLFALIAFGAGLGLTDTAMNSHAVTVQRAYGRPIMSSFHGFASLGALTGAVGGALGAQLSVGPQIYFLIAGGIALLVALTVRSWLLPGAADIHTDDGRAGGDHRAPWSLVLVLLAATGFLSLLAELAVGDWSAVYLHDNLDSSASVAAYGYGLYSLTMLSMRFLGDRITAGLGPVNVLRWGGLGAGVALSAGLLTNSLPAAVIAYGVVGIGMAGVVPIVFTTTGNLRGVPPGGALSKVAGFGYLGSMIGPPLIGLCAQATNLKMALFVTVAACLAIGVIGPLAAHRAQALTLREIGPADLPTPEG